MDAGELEGLSDAELRAKYEAVGKNRGGTHEDFSDLVEQEVAKRRKTGKYDLQPLHLDQF